MNLRHTWHDIADWWDRNQPTVALAAITIVFLWIIGMVFVGDTALEDEQPAPVYVHQVAATSPPVAAPVAVPTVEHLPAAPVGAATTDERCEP